VAVAAAVAAESAKADDLTQLAGVGPKASAALAAGGITTYAGLAEINEPPAPARAARRGHDPAGQRLVGPMQASFAAKGDWQGLMKYNARGRRRPITPPPSRTGPRPRRRRPDPAQRIGPRISTILGQGGVTTTPSSSTPIRRSCAGSSPRAAPCRPRASTAGRPRLVRSSRRLAGAVPPTTTASSDAGASARPDRSSGPGPPSRPRGRSCPAS
jgi:hypothetical protein